MNLKNRALIGVISASLAGAATLWEGNPRVPYDDIVGVLTVCQGYTGKDIIRNKTYTVAECDAINRNSLLKHRKEMLECVNVPITSYEADAYTLFVYNVGSPAFCKSKSVLGNLNAGNHKAACEGLLQWTYAGGKHVKGLLNRRIYERKMCLGELNA